MLNDFSQMTGDVLDRLETAATEKAPHLLPIVDVIRHFGVGYLVVRRLAVRLRALHLPHLHLPHPHRPPKAEDSQ